MAFKKYYNILGLGENSSIEEIKRAYRRLAKKYHPDTNPGDKHAEEKFKEIQEAYDILSDEEKKRDYDTKLKYGKHEKREPKYSSSRKKTPAKSSQQDKIIIIITVTVIASLIPIAYFFSGSNDEDADARMRQIALRELQDMPKQNTVELPPKKILNADSPYNNFFGDGIFSEDSRGYLMIKNSEQAEAVVCLVENKLPYKTIRNEYIGAGVDYRLTAIPNGKYLIKVYFGKEWNPAKKFLDGKISGGFEKEIYFCKYDSPNDIFEMKQFMKGDNIVFTSYEKKIDLDSTKSKKITAEEFFK